MNQIPGSAIAFIFLIALAAVIGNGTLVSSVSKLLLNVTKTSEDIVAVLEMKKPQSWYDLPETTRGDTAKPVPRVPKCLVNLHIPKVGGRTVGTFLQQVANLTGFERYPLYGHKGEEAWEDIVQAKRSRSKNKPSSDQSKDNDQDTTSSSHNDDYYENFLVQGHFSARIFEMYPELKECLIMTVLRQPVERAISAFFFHNHGRNEIDKCLSPENFKPPKNTADVIDRNPGDEGHPGIVIQRGNATILMSRPQINQTSRPDDDSLNNQTGDLATGAKFILARARIDARKKNLVGATQRCKLFWQYSNDMTLRFAGLPELPWKSWEMSEKGRKFRRDKVQHQQAYEQTRRKSTFSIASIPQTNETHLARAKDNIQNYMGLVCFLHDLPSCAERILAAFQLRSASETIDLSIMSTNKTTKYKTKSRPDELDLKELHKFRKANRFDQALYDWALQEYS